MMAMNTPGNMPAAPDRKGGARLEIVLKCDSVGSLEAVADAGSRLSLPGVAVAVIGSGVGAVSRSDVLLAETAAGLVAGFQVGVVAGLEKVLREHRVEVRLYEVIYSLTEDLRAIAESLVPAVPAEEIIGSGKVVALFRGSRRGVIVGCEVTSGHLAAGQHFRIISYMGPIYSGVMESLHIEDNAVQKAMPGQKVGIKIRDFSKARVGDLVESYKSLPPRQGAAWRPSGRIIRI
jgi:translation initiation factor IF-2